MRLKIVTDSAADLAPEEIARLGITVAPLFIQFPEGEMSAADIAPDAFYNRLEAMRPAFPTTSQPSAGVFSEIYDRLAADGSSILSLHISAGLSGTLASAELGRGSRPVTIWDTATLSGAQRFQVLAAAALAAAGEDAEAIKQRLSAIRDQTEIIYTLETLEYLARGGRIGRVQALAGSLLGLKPIIRVDHADGKYSTAAKARTMAKALAAIGEQLLAVYQHTPLWVTVLHGRAAEQAEALADGLRQKLNIARLETVRISPVLGVHTGPGVIGAAAVPMHLMPDAERMPKPEKAMA